LLIQVQPVSPTLNFSTLWTVVENYLKKIRVERGLTITNLSKLSNVSTTVISQLERMLIQSTQVTKNKIINGLNAEESSTSKKWKYEEVFPGNE